MSSPNHVLDWIPGYALDCLSHGEMLQVAEHLSGCASCRAELEAYRQVVDQFTLAIPEISPRPALKQNLLQRLAEGPVQAPAESFWSRFWKGGQGSRRAQPAWALAGLLLIVILAAGNVWLLWRVNRLEAATPENFQVVLLAGTDKAPTASGILVINQDGESGTLVVDSLPPLDEARQYQLWLIQDGKRSNGGVFSVLPNGYGTLAIYSEQPLNNFSTFGITVEPAGGSPGPTGDKVLGGNL
jgi:anti-sigma-K factor RskA